MQFVQRAALIEKGYNHGDFADSGRWMCFAVRLHKKSCSDCASDSAWIRYSCWRVDYKLILASTEIVNQTATELDSQMFRVVCLYCPK